MQVCWFDLSYEFVHEQLNYFATSCIEDPSIDFWGYKYILESTWICKDRI